MHEYDKFIYYIYCIYYTNGIINNMASSSKILSLNPISAIYQPCNLGKLTNFSEPVPFSVKWDKLYTYLQHIYRK